MIPPLDIFKVYPNGDVLWIESARDIETAKTQIRMRGPAAPGEYVILSQITGRKTLFMVNKKGELTEAAY